MSDSVVTHPTTGEELWTLPRVAEVLRVSRSTLRRHLYDPVWALKVYQRGPGARHWVTRSSVEAALPRVWPEPADPAGPAG